MTAPISNERVLWLKERAKVVDKCINVATTQMYPLQQGGQRNDLGMVLKTLREEQLSIDIELRVLQEYFDVKP